MPELGVRVQIPPLALRDVADCRREKLEFMTANVTKLEDNKVRLEVEVSPEAVKKGVEAKVRELRGKVRVPGFRPGKAPRRMLENHLGRDYIYMEAL